METTGSGIQAEDEVKEGNTKKYINTYIFCQSPSAACAFVSRRLTFSVPSFLFPNIALQRLDRAERGDYETALSEDPTLVERESSIADFLMAESHDVSRAALRLARYWQARKQIFGDRWLLPMNQVGFVADAVPKKSSD